MRIRQIDHVQLAMPSGNEAEARVLWGCSWQPEVPKPSNLAKRGGCWFVRDALKVHLGVEDDFRPARKAHPAFLVEDLSGLKTLIEAAGYAFKTDEPLEGYDRIYVDDPFGNRIELMEPLSAWLTDRVHIFPFTNGNQPESRFAILAVRGTCIDLGA